MLDREGHFWHDGERVDHRPLAQAMHGWIARHPEDGRLILTNGYDWCYFRAEAAPFVVQSLSVGGAGVRLVLSDGSEELLDPATLALDPGGVVQVRVKAGRFEASFSRHAQTQLAPLLVSADPPRLRIGDREHAIAVRAVRAE